MTLTAKAIEKRRLRHTSALESMVDIAALVVLIIGVLVAVAFLFTLSIWGLFASMAALTSGVIHWLLLRCVAEHLRLQKKIAGIPYEGRITGPGEEIIKVCGNCGQMLHSETRCDSCGAEILLS